MLLHLSNFNMMTREDLCKSMINPGDDKSKNPKIQDEGKHEMII